MPEPDQKFGSGSSQKGRFRVAPAPATLEFILYFVVCVFSRYRYMIPVLSECKCLGTGINRNVNF